MPRKKEGGRKKGGEREGEGGWKGEERVNGKGEGEVGGGNGRVEEGRGGEREGGGGGGRRRIEQGELKWCQRYILIPSPNSTSSEESLFFSVAKLIVRLPKEDVVSQWHSGSTFAGGRTLSDPET